MGEDPDRRCVGIFPTAIPWRVQAGSGTVPRYMWQARVQWPGVRGRLICWEPRWCLGGQISGTAGSGE